MLPVAVRSSAGSVALRTLPADFVTALPSPIGPTSNTGLNPQPFDASRFRVSIDYCTLVFSQDAAARVGQTTRTICGWLFGGLFEATELRPRMWQFYRSSAYIVDRQGEVVGRIGCDGNGDTWCVSLTGSGCKQVEDWAYTYHQALYLDAHLSRVDVAFDDFDGQIFDDIRRVDALARSGAFSSEMGRPAKTKFWDDHGSNDGCSVYVGSKGRKELCVYEKGKEQGDPESPWIRCELRVWRSNGHVPLDALLRSHEFLVGAYDVLRDMIPLDCEGSRPETIRRTVAANANAAIRFLREQCGPLLHLLWTALDEDAEWFLRREVCRGGTPGRFKGCGLDHAELAALLRAELSPRIDPPF
jgi:phage replication initiation protein